MIQTSDSSTSTHEPKAPQTVGTMLRQAREHQGLSMADVATVTRIPRSMLENLERDRFDEYAAPVFARGHLINFAREVRLDPEVVLAAYEKQTGQARPARLSAIESAAASAKKASAPKAPRRASATPPPRRPGAIKRKYPQVAHVADVIRPVHMVGAALMVCALFVGAFFLNSSSATAQNPEEFPSPQAAEEEWSLEKDADQTRWFLEQPAHHENAHLSKD